MTRAKTRFPISPLFLRWLVLVLLGLLLLLLLRVLLRLLCVLDEFMLLVSIVAFDFVFCWCLWAGGNLRLTRQRGATLDCKYTYTVVFSMIALRPRWVSQYMPGQMCRCFTKRRAYWLPNTCQGKCANVSRNDGPTRYDTRYGQPWPILVEKPGKASTPESKKLNLT